MQQSSIEWTDLTWNPIRGCTEITPGCDHCYARTLAERFRGTPDHAYEHGFDLRLVPEKLPEPLLQTKSRRIFVNSMSDLFHKSVPTEYIKDIAQVMERADWHVFQILTKRSSRMRSLLQGPLAEISKEPHIRWGVSVEDRRHGFPRIRHLQECTSAKIKWLSIEPLLEDLGEIPLDGIDAVIVGGESGAGARPMHKEWVESILRQCREQEVLFFFKQWGGVRKKSTGRRLNGRLYNQQPPTFDVEPLPRARRRLAIAQVQERVRYWLENPAVADIVFRSKHSSALIGLGTEKLSLQHSSDNNGTTQMPALE